MPWQWRNNRHKLLLILGDGRLIILLPFFIGGLARISNVEVGEKKRARFQGFADTIVHVQGVVEVIQYSTYN